jgi:hypothetical protein
MKQKIVRIAEQQTLFEPASQRGRPVLPPDVLREAVVVLAQMMLQAVQQNPVARHGGGHNEQSEDHS